VLRPYSQFAYVCGFDDNRTLRRSFEQQWKERRDDEIQRGVNCFKQIARLASDIICHAQIGHDTNLRLVLNFDD